MLGSLPHRIRDGIGLGRRELGVGDGTRDGVRVEHAPLYMPPPSATGAATGVGTRVEGREIRRPGAPPRRCAVEQPRRAGREARAPCRKASGRATTPVRGRGEGHCHRRRREENVRAVPFSVAAPSGQALRNRGAETIEDISANVAGFSVQNLGRGQSQVAMRRVSGGQIVPDQPGVKEQVGVYLDESVVSMSLFTPDLDLFDMSRVEVLRGPQRTLLGSGSLSGPVRYITNQPVLGVTQGTGELGFSSLAGGGLGNDAKLAINVPLGSAAAVRGAAHNTAIGGFVDAVQPDLSVRENVDGGRRTGARVAVLLQPSERLSFTPWLATRTSR